MTIYFDNNATTPVDPRVLQAMLPYFTQDFGNAASRQHSFGQRAESAVDLARCQVASLIDAQPREIVFTSGATESDNLAILGVAAARHKAGNHIITVATEHPAVLDPSRHLERSGFRLTVLPVDRRGRVDPQQLADACTPQTILVSVMTANNEIGTVQPVAQIGRMCKERGILFHTDAVQAAGKIAVDVEALGADLLSLSAHKMYGPKGVGALFVRRGRPRVEIRPLIHGGGHERGLRSGTLPVPLIVGFGLACRLCRESMVEESSRLLVMRDRLWSQIQAAIPDTTLNGHPIECLPGTLNVCFAYIDAEALMLQIPGVALSSGSACTSASVEPSHVLKAIGLDNDRAKGSLRFSLGRFNTMAEVDAACALVVQAVHRLRAISPLYHLSQANLDR